MAKPAKAKKTVKKLKRVDPKKAKLIAAPKKPAKKKVAPGALAAERVAVAPPLQALGPAASTVLDRLHAVILSRRNGDPEVSHSARLLLRGTDKVAQKFGEEAVECVIEAVRGNTAQVVMESADVLYHLLVLWVDAGIAPGAVWAELHRREGISGVAEKAARPENLRRAFGVTTTKIP